ncbi:pilus assembly protein TadG-related protein [Nocardiopsis ansamitocini]|uniref:Membrane protein n=1 Tax=Nocardiopsis ansamitocini TaxID=1670832 RepID=A0A9W6UI99_9ACTN|nr:pilus assembly protein TadG-related protein [Nocardiopsis ansamitocini]GLU47477.1 membrane protein [Nocardiopsis ansamitocini]
MSTGSDRGQVTAFVVVMVSAFVMCLGLVLDGGGALRAKNRASLLAQEAARVGAQQLDWAAYRAGDPVAIDAAAAVGAAQGFLASSGASGSAEVSGDTVTVTTSVSYSFVLLPLGNTTVSGTASARPYSGPTTP